MPRAGCGETRTSGSAVEGWGNTPVGRLEGAPCPYYNKTTIALADIELLDAYPAIVICPPHLVDKWQREAEEVIPGVQARILSRIGKLPGEGRDVNEVRNFIDDYASGKLGHKAIAIVSETMAKSGPGWQPGVAYRYRLSNPKNAADNRSAELALLHRETFRVAMQEYKKAQTTFRESLKAGDDPAVLERQRVIMAQKRQAALKVATKTPVCPNCGRDRAAGELKNAGVCQGHVQGWAHDHDDGHRIHDDNGQPMWVWNNADNTAPSCNAAQHDFGRGRYRRWSIAEYIKSQVPRGFFKMLIADEVHEYRSKRSDRGVAFHQLVGATRYQLALTGTVYGGRSTSIFNLMYRLNFGDTVQDFRFNGEKQWAKQYGVLETRIYGGKNVSADDYSKFNARERRHVKVTEKPGVSPAILGRMINNIIFLTLKDLGVSLPAYREEMVTFALPEALKSQYRGMNSDLRSRAMSNRKWLSTWLQWSLARPNSAFRDEVVIKREHDDEGNVISQRKIMDLPAMVSLQINGEPDPTDLLPKEEWLVNFVKAERAAGRKVLVFVRQSGTRDIQPRLKSILSHAGLRTDVLHSNISTRRREAWINRRAPGLDALICNPRLVQTGLDLVQFSTVVFYEIQYDLYVIWQSMRRVWRLGQDKPVRVVFTAYEDTLEANAIQLMGKKMKAAQLLYGDEVGGAIVPDDDDGNFLLELARNVLNGEQLPDFKTLFSTVQDQGETTSPLGSPTSTSVRVPVFAQERLRQLWLEGKQQKAERRQRRNRRAPTPVSGQAQLSLF
ncbi:MAG: DEAD/DEAH box helicase [Anaerolineae bacterium]|nr:DEAD/DEAH box helicase [Anaerolineae bacterium]